MPNQILFQPYAVSCVNVQAKNANPLAKRIQLSSFDMR